MLFSLLKLPWSAFRHGKIHGYPATRNPIAWIPFFLGLVVFFAVGLLFIIGCILLLPVILILICSWRWWFRRKAGVFSEDGIRFPKAYGCLAIAWSDVREVVREREPQFVCYRIICGNAPAETCEYMMSSTPDNDAFECTLHERQIPFRVHNWFDEPVIEA